MARLIKRSDAGAGPIVDADDGTIPLISFRVATLAAGEELALGGSAYEHCVVPFSGTVRVLCDAGPEFDDVGGREGVFGGPADSVFVPRGEGFRVVATSATEVAIAGGRVDGEADGRADGDAASEPFRIRPEEIEEVDVGSPETHSRRRIRHVLGQRQNGRVRRLLVSELYADPGCWSGYPPHKHDTDDGDAETDHEELYHYRFDPDGGFGTQHCYVEGGSAEAWKTEQGDTFCLDRGYHPTSTSPGHRGYIFTILVGRTRRGLVQRFDERHAHLMEAIPGIADMRAAFR